MSRASALSRKAAPDAKKDPNSTGVSPKVKSEPSVEALREKFNENMNKLATAGTNNSAKLWKSEYDSCYQAPTAVTRRKAAAAAKEIDVAPTSAPEVNLSGNTDE